MNPNTQISRLNKSVIELIEEKAISKCNEDMKNKLIDRFMVIKDCLSKETQEVKE